jgi:hypothetical protein
MANGRISETIQLCGTEWVILDERGDKVLVLCKNLLGFRAYNDERNKSVSENSRSAKSFSTEFYTETEGELITWETCDSRISLNGEFYNVIPEEERVRIVKTPNENGNNPTYKTKGGNDTEDYIFLLSIEEAERYFDGNDARVVCDDDGEPTDWWLRSPGMNSGFAAYVNNDGEVHYDGHRVNDVHGLRPAMWVRV